MQVPSIRFREISSEIIQIIACVHYWKDCFSTKPHRRWLAQQFSKSIKFSAIMFTKPFFNVVYEFQVTRSNCENFEFSVFGSSHEKYLKNQSASSKVPSKVDCLSFEVSYVKVGALLLLKKVVTGKKIVV